MVSTRILAAGAVSACILSATAFSLAAHAELLDASLVPAPAPMASSPVMTAPQRAPAPAAPAEPAAPVPNIQAPADVERETAPRPARAAGNSTDAQLECLARVILYEAGNQSRAGQLAVAQVVMNRVRSPRFPGTICGVINQRGQFSNIRGFRAPRGARWSRALAIARDARNRVSAPVVGNAMFFHATHVRPFRGRVRVARLGDHIFYR